MQAVDTKEDKSKIFIEKVVEFMKVQKSFSGSATELAALLAPHFENEIFPNRLTRDLIQNAYALKDHGIEISTSRSNKQRIIAITYNSDSSDGRNAGVQI